MKRFYTLHIPPQGHKASIQHQKRFWLTAIALTRRSLRYFFFPRQPRQSRVPGNACERRRWRIQRAGVGAAVEKIKEKRQPEDFFGYRKRGCEVTSSPSAPAKPKRSPLHAETFSISQNKKRTRGTRSVPGNACERRLVDACCISCAAISKIAAYSFRGVSSSQKVTLRSPARL